VKQTVVILMSSGLFIHVFFFNIECILSIVQLYLKIWNHSLPVKTLLYPLHTMDLSKHENLSTPQNCVNNGSRRPLAFCVTAV